MPDQPAPCSCPSPPMHMPTCPVTADLWRGVAPGGEPGPLPALQSLRARLADERDRAVDRAPRCKIPEARLATEGIAAGLATAIFILDGEIRKHGGDVPDSPRTTPDNPGVSDDAAHNLLVAACIRNGYRLPQPGVRLTVADAAEVDRMVQDGTPFGEAVGDVVRYANYRATQAKDGPDDTDRTEIFAPPDGLRDRGGAALREHGMDHFGDQVPADEYDCCAAAALVALRPELADLAALRAVATGYCPHCGRGDAAPTADQYLVQVHRADTAEAKLARVRGIADELVAHGSTWDGNEREAGRRIIDAITSTKETPS